MRRSSWGLSLFAMAILGMTLGCEPTAKPVAKGGATKAVESAEHDHDHEKEGEHSHDEHAHEDHGPNGGHMLHLEPGGAHAEWAHEDDKNLIQVYVPELQEAGTEIEEIRIDVSINKGETKAYKLEPQKYSDNKVHSFAITDPALVTALQVKEGVEAQLIVKTKDGELKSKIEHGEHDHDH